MISVELERNGGVAQESIEHPDHVGESDWRITIFVMPTGYLAAGTNGDPIYEEDSEAWCNLKEEYQF